MMRKLLTLFLVFATVAMATPDATAESKRHYQNRFRMMLDFAVRTNEFVRRHLEDKNLAAYAQSMAERNSDAATQMTPPKAYGVLHPHFLLVLTNIERSFYFASQGRLDRYRHHQKVVRKELHLLETLAEREQLELYMWDRDW